MSANRKPNHGPSVLRGGTPEALLRLTSVSTIQSADVAGTEGGCLRKFYYEKVLGKKLPSKKSQDVGVEVHAQLEHYLTTFPPENVLGPIALLGKSFLPTPGPDLHVEQTFSTEASLRDALALREARGDGKEIGRLAGLDAAGVPLIGFIDVWHSRGEYVDEEGVLRKEDVRVAEAVDHKTSSDVERWSKTADQLSKTVQMIGYGEFLRRRLAVDAVRLSHINYPTKGKVAKKVTTLVPVSEIVRSWTRVEDVVREMEQVIKVPSVDDVPANPEACGAYGGCGHKSYCARPERTVLQLLGIKKKGNDTMEKFFGNGVQTADMSEEERYNAEVRRLMSVVPPDAPSPSLVESVDPIPLEEIARIEDPELRARAEAHRLAAQASVPPPRASGKTGKSRCSGGGQRVSLTPKDAREKHKTCPACGTMQKLKNFSEDCDTAEITGHMIAPSVPAPPVLAPPAPPALPVPPAPVLAPPAPPALPVPPAPPALPPVLASSVFPAPPTLYVVPSSPPSPSLSISSAAHSTLYVDVLFDRGTAPPRLDAWFDDLVATVQKEYGVSDIREATGNHPLAYGRWRAVLAMLVRANPPPCAAGECQFRVGSSELRQVVLEAVEPLFERVIRGSR